ncbi:MAG TPA: 4'-phosphopantetheinyl transferase superfamily protein [Cytophagaceae bacterium]|jgi:hypothetical protein
MPLLLPLLENNEIIAGLWEITEPIEELILQVPKYIQSAPSFSSDLRLQQWYAGRALIHKLAILKGMNEVKLHNDDNGKICFSDHCYNLSLSHKPQYSIAILSEIMKVGIDMEEILPRIAKIGPRVLSESEMEDAGASIEKLTVYWCVKEVLYKIYSKRALSFKENLIVIPFEFKNEQGNCIGKIKTTDFEGIYNIKYLKKGNYIIAYNQ